MRIKPLIFKQALNQKSYPLTRKFMINDGDYPDLTHLSSEYPAGKETLQTASSQDPSNLGKDPVKSVQKAFKDYFCPFCGYKLFRGQVRDYKMVCHTCNRFIDSKKLEE